MVNPDAPKARRPLATPPSPLPARRENRQWPTIGHEIQFQRETAQRETTVNQLWGQEADANPVANAMFNEVGKLAIYGGKFVQNITVKSDKRTWSVAALIMLMHSWL
jgi:hypothetical protein